MALLIGPGVDRVAVANQLEHMAFAELVGGPFKEALQPRHDHPVVEQPAKTLLVGDMPDLDLVTTDGPLRVFTLLHDARPVLLNLGEPGGFDSTPRSDRVQLIDATYDGEWELPALGLVEAPATVLIRPDGYVAWVGDGTENGLRDALTTWFGSPTP